ncbi:Uu.00g016100.m01.CDS01 [Anthostomella pinea]|uniref:Uu.00g016100.m01.CDS01 n=1 Tax=Anthostomella pinea TaxID=933095 RepID=A0AAI8YQJ7_9PEZI|nr:Uu.00g016100.m01.CDS01 [Anthostomella pinea]
MDSIQSPLLPMPLEVLTHITSYLTTPEYCALRRTCKHIEASLFKDFAREFFSKRQFCIAEFSLQALVDIAQSRFGPSLTYLVINLERPTLKFVDQWILPGLPPSELAARKNQHIAVWRGHKNLIDTLRHVDLLAEALQKLPNLETVGMRDFNSRTRYRDGTVWHSYGTQTETTFRFERPSGTPGERAPDSESASYIRHVFLAILTALGRMNGHTDCAKPQRLEVILRHAQLSDGAFDIPPHLEASISSVLANLKAIFLDLNSIFPMAETNVMTHHGYMLSQFLLRAQPLEHLRLNFQGCHQDGTKDILSWLSQTPQAANVLPTQGDLLKHLLKPVPAPDFSLKHLEIGFTEADPLEPKLLLSLYKRYSKTLRTTALHKVALRGPHQATEKVNIWAKFFDQLAELDLQLSRILLSNVSQTCQVPYHVCKVGFSGGPRSPELKSWSGSAHSLSHALKDYAKSSFVTWPPTNDTDGGDTSQSDSSDPDDDSDESESDED